MRVTEITNEKKLMGLFVDLERVLVAQPLLAVRVLRLSVRLGNLRVRLTKPHSQEWLCYSIACSRKIYLLGGVCVLSTTFC